MGFIDRGAKSAGEKYIQRMMEIIYDFILLIPLI
jgi:hypothetical protein